MIGKLYSVFSEIKSGPGGEDSKNWAYLLYKQYISYFILKKIKYKIIEFKTFKKDLLSYVLFEIKPSKYITKKLIMETGIHKLIRKSKFKKKDSIQTSLCYIKFVKRIKKKTMNVLKKELRIETFKSSGPGGQSVNKTNSAVRIIHIPTGISVECQKERSQHINKKIATKKIMFKISIFLGEKKKRKIINWSKSVRIYFLNKSLIVDNIYKKKTRKIKEVLNGNLDILLEKKK
ncbi:peptide chain release factor-like protein [Candidatus Vidania fulgoroideorum]